MSDFAKIYAKQEVEQWQLPGIPEADAKTGVFRDLLISWDDLPRNHMVPMWRICCDVLQIDGDIVIERDTVVFARRIEVTDSAGLIVNRAGKTSVSLMIFAQEVVDKKTGNAAELPVTMVSSTADEKKVSFKIAEPKAEAATGMRWKEDEPEAAPMRIADLDKDFLNEGEPLRLYLRTLFQVAILLSSEAPDLSVSQLRWISDLAAVDLKQTGLLATQAASMAMTLVSTKEAGTNAIIVPQLDLEIYSDKAAAFMQVLRSRVAKWDHYRLQIKHGQMWADAARDVLGKEEKEATCDRQLEDMATHAYQQMAEARWIAARNLAMERVKVNETQINFEQSGIPDWRQKNQLSAAFDLLMGLGQILAQIPTLVVAGPEALIGTLAQTAQTLPNLAIELFGGAEARKALPDPKPSTETKEMAAIKLRDAKAKASSAAGAAGEGATKVIKAALKIAEIAAKAEQMADTSREILSAATATTGSALATIGVEGLDVVTGGSQEWDLLKAEIESLFDTGFDGVKLNEIKYGPEYKLGLCRLIIHGQALSQAKLALAKASAQLAEAKLRSKAKKEIAAISRDRLKKLAKQTEEDAAIAQMVFDRVLDAKRTIWVAMESYQRAFQYFTLAEGGLLPTLPRITGSIDDFEETVAQIQTREDQLLALRKSSSLPAPMDTAIQLTNADLLNSLKEHGFASFEIGLDSPVFNRWGRVRFTSIRVFLEGLPAETEGNIEIQIVTSGVYSDRVPQSHGKVMRFVTQGLRRGFVYRSKDRHIEHDAEIAPRYKDDFFQPTPFTTWALKVRRQDDQPLDLSKITGLTLGIKGESTYI